MRALTCPTKLFYLGKFDIYKSKTLDNEFLKNLAKGGFQVGALAQAYNPQGIKIAALDHETALKETAELLKKDNITIFEAAFKFNNLFVRVDILNKFGNSCELIEVKSKSAEPENFIENLWDKAKLKRGIKALKVAKGWRDVMYDIAFQLHVCKNARPDLRFVPHIMFADKTAVASVDGLNQKFFIEKKDGRLSVKILGDISKSALGDKMLTTVDVSEVTEVIFKNEEKSERVDNRSFNDCISDYENAYVADKKIHPPVGVHCKKCEFRINEPKFKSGFNECWTETKGLNGHDFERPFSFDIWYSPRAKELLDDKKIIFMKDVKEEDLGTGSRKKRQWLQVQKEKYGDKTESIDLDALESLRSTWNYPLHFIDFETCAVAIPFIKGKGPYEEIAFQFSHHVIDKNHKISHVGQYINLKPGTFPNFEFVRKLMNQLNKDDGTIFMYANHENKVLRAIYKQLDASSEADKKVLMDWIDSVTRNKLDDGEYRTGARCLVDLRDIIIESEHYLPATNGSNSLKAILPALLNSSEFLKEKYSKPVYGKDCGTTSSNFDSICWIQKDSEGVVEDPYKRLPPAFDSFDRATLDLLTEEEDEDIDDGGAAMMAYALCQFTQMSSEEREKIQSALLKYCELDTLAMVFLWEHWQNLLANKISLKKAT